MRTGTSYDVYDVDRTRNLELGRSFRSNGYYHIVYARSPGEALIPPQGYTEYTAGSEAELLRFAAYLLLLQRVASAKLSRPGCSRAPPVLRTTFVWYLIELETWNLEGALAFVQMVTVISFIAPGLRSLTSYIMMLIPDTCHIIILKGRGRVEISVLCGRSPGRSSGKPRTLPLTAGRPGGQVVALGCCCYRLTYEYSWFWSSNPAWVGLLSLFANTITC